MPTADAFGDNEASGCCGYAARGRNAALLICMKPAARGHAAGAWRPCESGGCPSSLARINPTEKGH